MSRIVVVTIMAMVACAFASKAQTAQSQVRAALEQMSQAERKNSRISVEFESSDSEAISLGRQVEQLWNSSHYDEALAQLGNLEARVGHVAIGNSWRKPVPTREDNLWGGDVRIGNRDSLLGLAADANMYDDLLVAFRHGHGPAYYSVCMSADGGSTWAETFTWVGSPVTCLDAVILDPYFYVAYYSPGESPQQVRLRQFLCSDGSADEFSNGAMWVAACTLGVGDTASEVSLTWMLAWLRIATLVSDGSVLRSTSDDWTAVTWHTNTVITSGASRGLDAAWYLGKSGSLWYSLSYLDGTDTMRIYRAESTGFTQRLALFCGTGELTSISAYNESDSVVCAYEDGTASPHRVGYAVSHDDGKTWTTGTLSDTSTAAEAPAVMAAGGGGFAAVFRQESSIPELRFRARSHSGSWTAPVSIADNEPYWGRPSIQYLGTYPNGTDAFGVVYLSDTSPVVRGAYFDRSDGPFGSLAERRQTQASNHTQPATVVRGVLFLPSSSSPSRLLNVAGREVIALRLGANDVSRLAPGVYFVRSEPSAVSRQPSAVTKVVVTR